MIKPQKYAQTFTVTVIEQSTQYIVRYCAVSWKNFRSSFKLQQNRRKLLTQYFTAVAITILFCSHQS